MQKVINERTIAIIQTNKKAPETARRAFYGYYLDRLVEWERNQNEINLKKPIIREAERSEINGTAHN